MRNACKWLSVTLEKHRIVWRLQTALELSIPTAATWQVLPLATRTRPPTWEVTQMLLRFPDLTHFVAAHDQATHSNVTCHKSIFMPHYTITSSISNSQSTITIRVDSHFMAILVAVVAFGICHIWCVMHVAADLGLLSCCCCSLVVVVVVLVGAVILWDIALGSLTLARWAKVTD